MTSHDIAPSTPSRASHTSERGATLIEYVGLGAVSAMLVTGVAAALDSTLGERFGSMVVAKLLEAISGS